MSTNDYDDDELNTLEIETPEENDTLADDAEIEQSQAETVKDDDDDKESYSKRVNKRINKLTYERNIERELRAKEAAELRAEIEALKQDRLKETQERNNQSLEQQRQALLQRKKDALEIGDFDEAVRLDDDLMDIKIKSQQAKADTYQQPTHQEYQTPVANTPKAQAEWEANNAWVFDKNQSSRLDKANKIFAALIEDGYDADDPDTFTQLDKKLKRETPPSPGAVDRGQVTVGDDNSSFTPTDKQKMINWGLDPNNAEHRKQWIKNKASR